MNKFKTYSKLNQEIHPIGFGYRRLLLYNTKGSENRLGMPRLDGVDLDMFRGRKLLMKLFFSDHADGQFSAVFFSFLKVKLPRSLVLDVHDKRVRKRPGLLNKGIRGNTNGIAQGWPIMKII